MPVSAQKVRLVTVADVVGEHLRRCGQGQSEEATTERRRLLEAFANDRGDIPLEELIPDDLEGWIEAHPSWKSDWTRRRVASTINHAFHWAMRKGLTRYNPLAGVSYQRGPRGRPLSDQHFRALLRETTAVFRRVLLFAHVTGSRPEEICCLEWSMIDTQEGTATLYEHKTARSRKDRAPRVVFLPAVALRLLVWIRCRQAPNETHVFLSSRNRPWKRHSMTCRVWELKRKLGLPREAKLYGLRHRWATDLALAGVELATLAVLLGHTSVQMAEHYTHIAGHVAHLRAELERGLKNRKK